VTYRSLRLRQWYPIDTNVVGFSEELIRDAISYETQWTSIFINNRIENIKEVAGMIQRLVPNAELELVMGRWKGRNWKN
jgi:transcription-repair coupling factor (superfamily II helicase)